MKSNPEEALLLLNKWRSEAVRVTAFVLDPETFTAKIEGLITRVEDATGTVSLEADADFILFRTQGSIGYGEAPEVTKLLSDTFGVGAEKWNSVLVFNYPSGARIVLCVE